MKIINKKLNNSEKYELFQVILDALEGLDSNSKSLEFDEYFIVLEHFYDEAENFIGIGISSQSSQFVLNDETREDFNEIFREARDYAIEKTEMGEEEQE